MSEAELADQITQMMSITLQGIGVVFSIVSAYVVALYYFLYRAPVVLKISGFVFFTLIGALLVFFMLGAFDHGAAINQALADLAANGPPLSPSAGGACPRRAQRQFDRRKSAIFHPRRVRARLSFAILSHLLPSLDTRRLHRDETRCRSLPYSCPRCRRPWRKARSPNGTSKLAMT